MDTTPCPRTPTSTKIWYFLVVVCLGGLALIGTDPIGTTLNAWIAIICAMALALTFWLDFATQRVDTFVRSLGDPHDASAPAQNARAHQLLDTIPTAILHLGCCFALGTLGCLAILVSYPTDTLAVIALCLWIFVFGRNAIQFLRLYKDLKNDNARVQNR